VGLAWQNPEALCLKYRKEVKKVKKKAGWKRGG
jgi:hypothetical protein